VRLAYPYQNAEFPLKKDIVHAIGRRLKNGQQVKGVTDHIMTPTFIDDIAVALDKLIQINATGIYHVVGSQSLSPYDAAIKIAEKFKFDISLVTKITREEYFANGAKRPFNLSLNNDKIQQLGIKMRGFEQGLAEVIL
jgi:dTDP-4-dehydrorhamnose reductase